MAPRTPPRPQVPPRKSPPPAPQRPHRTEPFPKEDFEKLVCDLRPALLRLFLEEEARKKQHEDPDPIE